MSSTNVLYDANISQVLFTQIKGLSSRGHPLFISRSGSGCRALANAKVSPASSFFGIIDRVE